MLSGALQRNAKHEARLSNISGCPCYGVGRRSEIESLASRTSSAALQLRFAQNDRKPKGALVLANVITRVQKRLAVPPLRFAEHASVFSADFSRRD
jgi:hypothetical protein